MKYDFPNWSALSVYLQFILLTVVIFQFQDKKHFPIFKLNMKLESIMHNPTDRILNKGRQMIHKTNTEIQRDRKREMERENGFRKASKEGNRSIIQKSSSHTCTDNKYCTYWMSMEAESKNNHTHNQTENRQCNILPPLLPVSK
jgi:phosphopantothenoylcysteine synthetase/decarboxylase